jgi:hypothetical protein
MDISSAIDGVAEAPRRGESGQSPPRYAAARLRESATITKMSRSCLGGRCRFRLQDSERMAWKPHGFAASRNACDRSAL